MLRRFKKIGDRLIEPAWIGDARERHLSRILNVILLVLLTWGILFEVQSKTDKRPSMADTTLVLIMIGLLTLAYYSEPPGTDSRQPPCSLLDFFITPTFVAILLQDFRNVSDLSVLYYLIIAILMSELFFSMRGLCDYCGGYPYRGICHFTPGSQTPKRFLLFLLVSSAYSLAFPVTTVAR